MLFFLSWTELSIRKIKIKAFICEWNLYTSFTDLWDCLIDREHPISCDFFNIDILFNFGRESVICILSWQHGKKGSSEYQINEYEKKGILFGVQEKRNCRYCFFVVVVSSIFSLSIDELVLIVALEGSKWSAMPLWQSVTVFPVDLLKQEATHIPKKKEANVWFRKRKVFISSRLTAADGRWEAWRTISKRRESQGWFLKSNFQYCLFFPLWTPCMCVCVWSKIHP